MVRLKPRQAGKLQVNLRDGRHIEGSGQSVGWGEPQ